MPVSTIIIPRLNAIFPPAMVESQAQEYWKVLKSFPDSILDKGMDSLANDYDGRFRPTPAVVRRFCIDVERENATDVPKGRNPMADARELVKDRKVFLDGHGAYRLLRQGHVLARVKLSRLIDERAMIQAQAICSRPATGYDAELAFGYGTWGPKLSAAKFKTHIQREINLLQGKAIHSGLLDVDVPQEAIDWFNNLIDIDISDASGVSNQALLAYKSKMEVLGH